MPAALGLDFGTTNTVLSQIHADGKARPIICPIDGVQVEALRSALCFWQTGGRDGRKLHVEAGPYAIRQFIDHPGECRFIQSFKTFGASQHFPGTYIYGKRYKFEDLLEGLVARIRDYESAELDELPRRLVVGRPVEFAGAQPDAALAQQRYDAALRRFGFAEILYVYEPVAAAFFFARNLAQSATVLVADFGGGTTDYSIIRFELSGNRLSARPLGHGGIGIAGDNFDFRIIDNVILPRLGKGSQYRHMGKTLELPQGLFANFARWNQLSVLKTMDEFRDLKGLLRWCVEPDKIQKLIDLIEDDQGYPLYKAISEAKARLSSNESVELRFPPLGDDFQVLVERGDFETWIADDLRRMERVLDDVLARAQTESAAIDKVFLTGGTSFVPAVRQIFERRFGSERIESGDELLSIANGLAMIGEQDDAEQWAVNERT
ncbi:MAG TPA: Hsp70 family protein [Xanthobacteraceae bacterium]|jgi:hypothetical chaperone protein|nr:Hsp70 family protein [Xanthobacteraceae bacterium]